jgi:hypothetical protein
MNRKSRFTTLALLAALMVMMVFAGVASADHRQPLFAQLTGAAERPNPGDPDGSGVAVVKLNERQGIVCWAIQVKDIKLPASAAHIHVGAAGVPGPVVVPLSAPDASGFASGCTNADPALVMAIQQNPAGYYVNVHNSDFPGGAVRGQLQPIN